MADNDILRLERRIDELERRSGLMSRSFLTRALSVFGYVLLVQFLFTALIFAGMLALAMLGGFMSALQLQ